jgi:hypothetical protein
MAGALGIDDPFPPGPPRGGPSPTHVRFDQPLTNGRAAWLGLWLALGFALTCAAVMLLPSARYVRYQQEAGTIQFHARWVYERIHFDPTPIDVAIIGTSRLEAGVSPVELQRRLSAKLGRPVHVADFALVQMGRNLHYAIAKDLLNTRPEVKLIVLSAEEGAAAAHPLFRYVGDDIDIARSPIFFNFNYFNDLFYLPIRHLTNFAETIAPSAFGIDAHFQPSQYLGTDLDRTAGYRTPEGAMVNGARTEPPEKLAQQAQFFHETYTSTLRYGRFFAPKYEYAVDYKFTKDIARLAAQHNVKLVFLHLPMYTGLYPVNEQKFYQSLAPFLDEQSISRDPQMYFDGAHLNRSGALVTSRWLADRLVPYLSASKPMDAHE